MKSLIVDDSRAIRAVLSRYVRDLGIEPVEAGDSTEAMAALQRDCREVGVIFLDWNLPGKSGYDILVDIRANPEWSQIPVIMCTTETEFARMQQALDAGANEYVMKPFSRLTIMEKLGLVGVTRP